MRKNINLPFRRAVVEKLTGTSYLGVELPICEKYLNKEAALVNIGNTKRIKAWIQIMDQTSTPESPKCIHNDRASLHIQVRTAYNANSGSSEIAEEMSNEILAILFPSDKLFDLELPEPFNLWKLEATAVNNLDFPDNTDRIWMVMITLEAQISQPI